MYIWTGIVLWPLSRCSSWFSGLYGANAWEVTDVHYIGLSRRVVLCMCSCHNLSWLASDPDAYIGMVMV